MDKNRPIFMKSPLIPAVARILLFLPLCLPTNTVASESVLASLPAPATVPTVEINLAPPLSGDLADQQFREASAILRNTPVIVKGVQLPELDALPDLGQLHVVKMDEDHQLSVLPFQFDQYDVEGLIYLKGVSKKPLEGDIDRFDPCDELVFMYQDAGQYSIQGRGEALRRSQDDWSEPLLEFKITAYDGSVRYVSLVESMKPVNSLKSESTAPASTEYANDYVFTDIDKGEVETDTYRFTFNPKNLAEVKTFSLKRPEATQASIDLFKNYHLAISTGVLSKGLRVGFDSKRNIFLLPQGVVQGPVRSTLLYDVKLTWLKFPLYRNPGMLRFYRNGINIPSRFANKQLRALSVFVRLLKAPKIELSFVTTNVDGGSFLYTNDFGERRHFFIDGEMTDDEWAFNQSLMFGQFMKVEQESLWDALFANHVPVVPGGLFETYLGDMKIYNHYRDQRPTPQSDVELVAGVRIEGLPMPLIRIMTAISAIEWEGVDNLGDFVDTVLEPKHQKYLERIDKINAEMIAQMRQRQQDFDVERYIQAFLTDFSYFEFGGVERANINALIESALRSCETLEACSLTQILTAFQAGAQAHKVDLSSIRHVYLDNTIWFNTEPAGYVGL